MTVPAIKGQPEH